MKTALGLLFVPPLAAQILVGGNGAWNLIFAYALYLIYLMTTGRKLNCAYNQQISDHYDLAVLAHHDHLTGLPNWLLMNELLESSLTK